jgi:hypothetical protein
MRQPFFLKLSRVCVHKSNLLEGQVIIASIINISAPLPRAFWLGLHTTNFTQVYGADIVIGINYTQDTRPPGQ